MLKGVYLDYNATTPLHPAVSAKIREIVGTDWFNGVFGNPSSNHSYGRKAHKEIFTARKEIADMLKCNTSEVVFTSCGTESNNISILGACDMFIKEHKNARPEIVISAIEHPATIETCKFAENRYNAIVRKIPVDSYGQVRVSDVLSAVNRNTAIASIMLANNEVGTILNVPEVFSKLRKCRQGLFPLLHSDCAQAVGKVPVTIPSVHCDLLSVAGHKLYAPKGVGVLVISDKVKLPNVVIHGAGQENGRRPGTENIINIAALGAAAAATNKELSDRIRHSGALVKKLYDLLRSKCPKIKIEVNGKLQQHLTDGTFEKKCEELAKCVNDPEQALRNLGCLPNTLSISFAGIGAAGIIADVGDSVCASVGSACHSGLSSMSPVLREMGFNPIRASGTFRLSVGSGLTMTDIESAANLLSKAINSAK